MIEDKDIKRLEVMISVGRKVYDFADDDIDLLKTFFDLATKYQNCKGMPKERKGIEIKGATVKCEFLKDCHFPYCICGTYAKPVPTKHRYKTLEDKGWNACLAECKMSVLKMRPKEEELLDIFIEAFTGMKVFKNMGDEFTSRVRKGCSALLKEWDTRIGG